MVFPIFTRNLLTLYTKWIVQVFECCISPFSFKYMEAFKCILITIESHINPFVPDAAFLYPLETWENRKVFWWFQGVEKECVGNEWVLLF